MTITVQSDLTSVKGSKPDKRHDRLGAPRQTLKSHILHRISRRVT